MHTHLFERFTETVNLFRGERPLIPLLDPLLSESVIVSHGSINFPSDIYLHGPIIARYRHHDVVLGDWIGGSKRGCESIVCPYHCTGFSHLILDNVV
jgi:hypothetical protein